MGDVVLALGHRVGEQCSALSPASHSLGPAHPEQHSLCPHRGLKHPVPGFITSLKAPPKHAAKNSADSALSLELDSYHGAAYS